MLDNCTYNKAKIIHELSSICWFLENHAIADAQKNNDQELEKALLILQKDLAQHLKSINNSTCSRM